MGLFFYDQYQCKAQQTAFYRFKRIALPCLLYGQYVSAKTAIDTVMKYFGQKNGLQGDVQAMRG
jgi:hypothetical protein